MLTRKDLLRLARAGAEARLAQLQGEIEAIYRTFPELRGRKGGPVAGAAPAAARRGTGKRGWTAAQRKAAAERMKKFWAARRADGKAARK